MYLEIGNKIRQLRKERGLTQEQLADSIGISFQAVSKWENNISMPDISVIPSLASYFGVSIDEIFDFNLQKIDENVNDICDEAYKYRESDPIKSKEILEVGLKKYPDNDILLNNLLYVMNCKEDPNETIKVASKLIDKTTLLDVKYDAYRFLAYAYKEKGEENHALAAIEQIPEIYFTRLTEMAFLLSGEKKYDSATKQKWISFENLLQMMSKIVECYEEKKEEELAAKEVNRAIKLIELFNDDEQTKIDSFKIYLDFFHAKSNNYKNNL